MTTTPEEQLSARELEVLARVVTGATNRQVATELSISPNTVKVHVSSILAKLGAQSRAEATLIALERGLVGGAERPQAAEQADGAQQMTAPPQVRWPLSAAAPMAILGLVAAILLIVLLPPLLRHDATATGTRLLDTPQETAPAETATGSRWRERLEMPTARARLALVAVGDILYAIGGQTADGPASTLEIYYTGLDLWGRGADMPTPVANISAVAVDELIFVPGGLRANGSLSDALAIYHPRLNAWAQAAPLPRPLCSYALAIWQNGFYLLGGWDGTRYVDTVYYYDVGSDAWHEVGRLTAARGFAAAAALGERVYLTGGYDGSTEIPWCESFAPDEAGGGEIAWQRHAEMSAGRAGHGVAAVNGSLYVCGGGWDAPLERNERYDARVDAWSSYESPVTGEWRTLGLAAVEETAGTFLYAVGGWSGDYRREVFAYQAFYRVYVP